MKRTRWIRILCGLLAGLMLLGICPILAGAETPDDPPTQEEKQAAVEHAEQTLRSLEEAYGPFPSMTLEQRAQAYRQIMEILEPAGALDAALESDALYAFQGEKALSAAWSLPGPADIPQEQALQSALDAVGRFFGPEIAEEISGQVNPFFAQSEEGGRWKFLLTGPAYGLFAVSVDARKNDVLDIDWRTPQGDWADMEQWLPLMERNMGLRHSEWPINDKWLYDVMMENFPLQYALPGEGELPYEEALRKAREACLAAYPELTREALDAARLSPYFYDRYAWLNNVTYEMRIYVFDFELADENGMGGVYSVILDAATGECLDTIDPSASANG